MDRDFTLEKHLLTRCYSSPSEIEAIIETRYKNNESSDPYLVLVPTSGPEGVKPAPARTHFGKNMDLKPAQARKVNIRRDMKVYIKKTLAAQTKLVKKVQHARKEGRSVDLEMYISRYNIPRYDMYLQLHLLWKQYIQDLLFGDQKNPNLNMVLPRLSTADFNGCKLRVIESRDRNLIGFEGIVLYDSQHSFMLVSPQLKQSNHVISPAQSVGGLKVVSKRGTMFAFDVECAPGEFVSFTILGSRFELRAVDRAGKKFKSRGVEDIY
ncbi:ribonuclease P protein subunit POP4 [Metschnikowia aff. pulcherrima]|uniref:Ribonuclease P protein subunit n=1 Tax=Metschnikowia aff. pulcherrima TaxID=2163413 RepID=A0A4P6XP46_9ASCO|nr:ribonuclease P protein subunit POP4 [Metschnikowia aff. pulcherrima]